MRDFGARYLCFAWGATPHKARCQAILAGQTGQHAAVFRVSPVMTASIPLLILLSRTRLHALWKNARFRCKIPVFCVGCNTPQGPLSGHPCRTNRPARRSFSSAAPSTTRTTLHIYFFWHRLARPSDECEISVQEQRMSGGVQGPAKPAAVGFTADEPASGSRPCECFLFGRLSNAPYRMPCAACVCGVHFIIAKPARAVNAKPRGGDRARAQNRRCLRVGVGSKGVSSWWRRMNTWRVFSVTLRPPWRGTV